MRPAWAADGPIDAPPVVLLHSLGSDRSMWAPQVGALAGGLHLVRPDTRGHGASPAPPGSYELADLGTDVLEVADAMGLDTFHLVGVSLGGLTALWLAAHHGDRVRSLVASNTAAQVGTAAGWQARIDAVRTSGLAGIRDEILDRFFAPGFAERDPAAVAAARRSFTDADADGYAACCRALATGDLRDAVGRIAAPTLVVSGDRDVAVPLRETIALHEAIPASALAVLPGAGHIANLERPDLFTLLLRSHLADTDGRG